MKILIKNKKDKEDKIKKYLENKKITPATITPAKTVITNQQSQTLTEKLLEQQKNCKLYESTRIYNK
ncbi:TPA: hypothetical protein DEG21_03325 [Patescibacteria group bacterium]|nr:hypothetical protein [Candidatus Gracilibacteria bacterium]HBY74890.1 hypothetical protein [Candidatus Gracilibacteria bacterium]